ncbi:hypothetical protein AURDEDRAFT_111296 [Auricularia subglabra TFB-10046 SS5]|nr:hypothetical protein AURDEDRAFT_111296 [Auricularia subglabra TFB-10046 SS5]
MAPSVVSHASTSKRASLLASLTFSFVGRRPSTARSHRAATHAEPDLYEDVLEISAPPTEDELERERLRAAAAQAVGIQPSPPSPPPQPAPVLPPIAPLPPFPAKNKQLAPLATLSGQVSKRMPGSGFLGRTHWKQRVIMLTAKNVHALVGQGEVERLPLSLDTVAYVADDEPGMGGRRSVIKLGSDPEWWTIQMRDAAQMHAWLQAVKAAVLALRPVSPVASVTQLEPPMLRVVSTSPTTPTFPFNTGSAASSPASSTRLSRTRSAVPPSTAGTTLKSLLTARRLSIGRQRSPSDPGNGPPPPQRPAVNNPLLSPTLAPSTPLPTPGPESIGRRIYESPPPPPLLPPPRPRSPRPSRSEKQPQHQHTMSLPPPPRPRRQRPATGTPSSPPPEETAPESEIEHGDGDEGMLPLPEFTNTKVPPSPELVIRDLPTSAFRHSRVSVISVTSANESDDREEQQEAPDGPTVKHPYGANGTSKSNKRLSTSSALSAGSAASGSGSSRFLRPGYGSGGVPPQRPPPVGALPPTPSPPAAGLPPSGRLPSPSHSPPSRPASGPPGTISPVPTPPLSMSNRRSVRMSLPLFNGFPPSLPPAGPLPPTPTHPVDRSRARNSVAFAPGTDGLSRSSSLRESNAAHSRTNSFGHESIAEEGAQPQPNGHAHTDSTSSNGNGRKRASLRLRFRPPSTSSEQQPEQHSSFLLPITPSSAGSSHTQFASDITPMHERGQSFLSPYTPVGEPSSFMYAFSGPPPMPSPIPHDLFTIPPMGPGLSPLSPSQMFPPPLPTPPPYRGSEQHLPLPANELFNSITVPNSVLGRGRAGSLSTLEMEPPEPRSLSPPPPRRANRASIGSVSKRASIGSAAGPRRSGDRERVRGSADSAISVPGIVPSRPSLESRPHTADAASPTVANGDSRPVEVDEKPLKPRIGMDGELLFDDEDDQHDDDRPPAFNSAIHLPLLP